MERTAHRSPRARCNFPAGIVGTQPDKTLTGANGRHHGTRMQAAVISSAQDRPKSAIRRRILMRVLLIEDHGALREMIAAHLIERGFAIDAVGDAEHARSALAAVAYDAAVVDLGLPDADGIELL